MCHMLKKILLSSVSALFLAFLYLHFGHNWDNDPLPPVKKKNLPPFVRKVLKKTIPVDNIGIFHKEKLVEVFLDSSGLWAQLGMPEKILNKHLSNPKMLQKISPEELENIKDLIQQKLGVDAISRKVKERLVKSFSPEELRRLADIYSTPVMKKVASLEEYLSSEDLLVKAGSIQLSTDQNSLRAKLLRKLEQVKDEGERNFQITLHSIKGLHQGFNRILPMKKRVPDSKINSTISILKKYARPKFKNLALIRYDYAYKELSNSELKDYISIGKSKLMLKAQEATFKGIIDAFEAI